jgi:hypothetical protein
VNIFTVCVHVCLVGDDVWSNIDVGLGLNAYPLDRLILFLSFADTPQWVVNHPYFLALYSDEWMALYTQMGIEPLAKFPRSSPVLAKDIGYESLFDPDYDFNIFGELPSDVIAIESTCLPNVDCSKSNELAGYVYVTSALSRWLYTATTVTVNRFAYIDNGTERYLDVSEHTGWKSEFLGHVLLSDQTTTAP